MAIYQGHNEDSSGNLLLSIGNGMTATVETGSIASQSYTKGSYLFFDNRLCKAASAIASGATLTIGGNLTQTSLGAEITSHLRSSDGKEFYFDVKDGQYGYYPSVSKTASEFVPFGGTELIAQGMYSPASAGSINISCKVGDIFIMQTSNPTDTVMSNATDITDSFISSIGIINTSAKPNGLKVYKATATTVTLSKSIAATGIRLILQVRGF